MVGFSHTLTSMFFRNFKFSDQLLSSMRRKVLSPFCLGIVLSFIVLSAVLFNISFKGSFNPVLKGLSSFGSHGGNSSILPLSFSGGYSSSGNNVSALSGCCNNDTAGGSVQTLRNGTIVANVTKSSDFVSSGDKDETFQNVHVGNMPENSKDGTFASFGVKRSRNNVSESVDNGILVNESGKGMEIEKGDVWDSVLSGKNESVDGERKDIFGNLSESGEITDLRKKETGPLDSKKLPYKECDIFKGRWVKDDTLPYYPPGSCPYIDKDFDCHLNGRRDSEFEKWRWQPNDCDIPRFNATDFLERLSGKKLVFVGDSLNRNMWESLVCALRHGVKDKSRVYEISGRHEFKKKGFYAFRFEDYNCTVDFVSSPFLVKESSFTGKNHTFETLRLDLMDQTTSMYHDADVMVFNTGHWWTHEKTSRGEDYYQEGNHIHPRLKVLEAYKRALLTWARWIDQNINADKTHVIFRGYSVTHFRGGPWNSGGQCHNETEPMYNDAHLAKYPSKMKILEYILKDMKTPVTYLNISRLTDYRKDAHPSIYRPNYQSQQQQEIHAQDCSHWCLPGVPDTWNELLYVSLLKSGLRSRKN